MGRYATRQSPDGALDKFGSFNEPIIDCLVGPREGMTILYPLMVIYTR